MEKRFIIVVVLAFALNIGNHLMPLLQLIKQKELPEITMSDLDKTKVYEVIGRNLKTGELIIKERDQ